MSSLIVSFVESSNHCILGIIFLGSCLAFLFVSFGVWVRLLVKLKFTENGFHMHLLLRFRCWRFCRFLFEEGFSPFYYWYFLCC